jgi:hypothetical protein
MIWLQKQRERWKPTLYNRVFPVCNLNSHEMQPEKSPPILHLMAEYFWMVDRILVPTWDLQLVAPSPQGLAWTMWERTWQICLPCSNVMIFWPTPTLTMGGDNQMSTKSSQCEIERKPCLWTFTDVQGSVLHNSCWLCHSSGTQHTFNWVYLEPGELTRPFCMNLSKSACSCFWSKGCSTRLPTQVMCLSKSITTDYSKVCSSAAAFSSERGGWKEEFFTTAQQPWPCSKQRKT